VVFWWGGGWGFWFGFFFFWFSLANGFSHPLSRDPSSSTLGLLVRLDLSDSFFSSFRHRVSNGRRAVSEIDSRPPRLSFSLSPFSELAVEACFSLALAIFPPLETIFVRSAPCLFSNGWFSEGFFPLKLILDEVCLRLRSFGTAACPDSPASPSGLRGARRNAILTGLLC